MKFDMGRAWSDATSMLSANRDTLLVVAGMFFFLPYFALMLFLPEQIGSMQANAVAGDNPDAALEAIGQWWWAFLVIFAAQAIGMLALLALLSDGARPTVGEALGRGGRYFLSYLGAQILQGMVLAGVIALPILVAVAAGSPALGVVLGIVAFIGFAYIFTKFSLVPPVIAIEKQGNPLTALSRSWRLTKGNSVRLFLFYVLLLVVLMVIFIVVSMIFGILFALMGPQGMLIGNALISSLVNAVWIMVFLAVLAAVHRQLAGPSAEAVSETFE